MRKTNSYSTWHEISVRKYFWPSLSWILAPSGLFFRGARGRVVALAKKRRLWRRSTLLCSPSSERRWQLHLPKTVQKCNCLVNAGHNSCQRPWKTTIRENTLRKKLFIQFIKGWVAKSYANLDWQSIANLFAAASCRSHTQPFSLDMIMIKRHIVALYLSRLLFAKWASSNFSSHRVFQQYKLIRFNFSFKTFEKVAGSNPNSKLYFRSCFFKVNDNS